MWTKTITIKYKGHQHDVLVFLSDSTSEGKEVVRVQSMVNEYYLMEDLQFESRDDAYRFIKHYPKSMAISFVIDKGWENDVFEN